MKNLLAKMLAVQKAIKPIERTEINPHFKSKYFDINSVIAELRPVLNNAGLVVTQGIRGMQIVTTVSDPESGEEKEYPMDLPPLTDPQKLGAAISYYRRYSLVSLFVLEAEDDDGNGAKPDAKDYAFDLELAEDLSSLKRAWEAVPKELQKALTGKKDAAKARIERKDIERKELETLTKDI